MRRLSDIVCHQHPFTMQPSATVRDACREMRDRSIGAVLVTNEMGHLLGIFTGRDAVGRVLAAGKSAARTKLNEVMTSNPTTMSPQMAVDALRLDVGRRLSSRPRRQLHEYRGHRFTRRLSSPRGRQT